MRSVDGAVQTACADRRVAVKGTPLAAFASSVGGGPLENLVRQLREDVVPAAHWYLLESRSWRAAMVHGGLLSTAVRVSVLAVFPVIAVARALLGPEQVVVTTTNPFILPWILTASRRLHRKKVIALFYDLYPEALIAAGTLNGSSLWAWAMAWVNRQVRLRADAVVDIGLRIQMSADARYGRNTIARVLETGGGRIPAASGSLSPLAQRVHEWRRNRLLLAYLGNLGHVHDWATLAGAWSSECLQRRLGDQACLLIAASGAGAERLRAVLPEGDRTMFVAPLVDDAWGEILREVDVSVVTLNAAARDACLPSKLFTSLEAGHAILAIAPPESDLARIVRETESGVVILPGKVDDAVAAIVRLATESGELARLRLKSRAAGEGFGMANLARRWRDLILEVAGAGSKERVRGGLSGPTRRAGSA